MYVFIFELNSLCCTNSGAKKTSSLHACNLNLTTTLSSSPPAGISTDVTQIDYIEITGPNDFHLRTTQLQLNSDTGFTNGQYRFEVHANTGNTSTTSSSNGRDGRTTTGTIISVVDTGYFITYNGAVVDVTTESK